MRSIFTMTLMIIALAACKPKANLDLISQKKNSSTTSSAGASTWNPPEFPNIPTDNNPAPPLLEVGDNTQQTTESAPPTNSHGVDVSKCSEFNPSDGASCKSHFGSVSWKLKKMSGDCSDGQIEMFCYEATGSAGTTKGGFYSYCNALGVAAEYQASHRETRKFSIAWALYDKEYKTSFWNSPQERFTLVCD